MSSVEIKREEEKKYSKLLKRKQEVEKLHQKLIEKAISVIKPISVLDKINNDFLKGRGEVTKQSLPYLELFDLGWSNYYIEADYCVHHQITIAFCRFLVGPNQVIKNVKQLLCKDTPKDTIYPAFVVLGGSEAKAIRNNLWDNVVVKNIYSLNPDVSTTVFEIPKLLGKINKTNLIKSIEPSFEDAIKKAYSNSALKEN